MRGMDNFTVDEWWGHGMRNLTPGRDEFMELEAGSTVTFELGCNRAFTTYRPPEWSYKYKPLMTHCCEVSKRSERPQVASSPLLFVYFC